jgi:hypothetical protein
MVEPLKVSDLIYFPLPDVAADTNRATGHPSDITPLTLGRAGLCPRDNRGKANSWRPLYKNLQKKKCEALQYCDSNEFIELTVGTSHVLMSKAATNNIYSNKHKA